jgi:DNA polymerase elongation subunit (family B)
MISTVLYEIRDKTTERHIHLFHPNGGCQGDVADAEVHLYTTEMQMLNEWLLFLRRADPDLLTGYNIELFDIPYILQRSRNLKMDKSFACWGRGPNCTKTPVKLSVIAGEVKDCRIGGRNVIDLLVWERRFTKRSSYKLGNVATEELGHTKDDMPYTEIPGHWKGTDQQRAKLARYCVIDSQLVIDLMLRANVVTREMQVARMSGVPVGFARGYVGAALQRATPMHEWAFGPRSPVCRVESVPFRATSLLACPCAALPPLCYSRRCLLPAHCHTGLAPPQPMPLLRT